MQTQKVICVCFGKNIDANVVDFLKNLNLVTRVTITQKLENDLTLSWDSHENKTLL